MTACSNNGYDDGGGSTMQPPSASTLTIDFDFKQLRFSWTAASGAGNYRLLEDPDGASGFTQVGSSLTATSTNIDIAVHFHNWAAARYALDACNSAGCTRSNEVSTTAGMLQAIGYVKASNTEADDSFGQSLALSSDGSTLATGAPGEASDAIAIDGDQTNNLAIGAGAVYVFSSSSESQEAYIKASNTAEFNLFGASFLGPPVALSSDGNTLAVGARGEESAAIGIDGDQGDNSAVDSGAVYVFTRSPGGVWTQQAYIKALNTGDGDFFGEALALSSDGNTLAVGARREDSAATGIDGDGADDTAPLAGAAYVFTRSGGVWSQQAYIKASNTDAGDAFGISVALSSDGNTLAVGARAEDSAAVDIDGDQGDNLAVDAGAAYAFTRDGGGVWTQQAYIKASNTGADDLFGEALALSSDGSTLVVGARNEDSAATGIGGDQADETTLESGAVYVFTRSGSTWLQQAYIKASNTGAEDLFGEALALSSDGNTLAVGAVLEDSNATGINGDQTDNSALEAGAVYVFTRSGSGVWLQQAYVKASNTEEVDLFGEFLALSSDGNILAVGAPGESSADFGIGGDQADNSAPFAGAVYIY